MKESGRGVAAMLDTVIDKDWLQDHIGLSLAEMAATLNSEHNELNLNQNKLRHYFQKRKIKLKTIINPHFE
jgi:hypothetical protein